MNTTLLAATLTRGDAGSGPNDQLVFRHVYHYCATKQLSGGVTVTKDGIAYCIKKVLDMAQYRELKNDVAASSGGTDGSGWSIISLTHMGREWVSVQGPNFVAQATAT